MMMEQLTLSEYLTDRFYKRDGSTDQAPKWVRPDRCGNCKHWTLMDKDEQPPDGWGVFGLCGSHRGKNQYKTTQSSYCQEFEPRYE